MRRIDTASMPSASAMRTATAAISSRREAGPPAAGLGPDPDVDARRGGRPAARSAAACFAALARDLGRLGLGLAGDLLGRGVDHELAQRRRVGDPLLVAPV